MMMILKLRASIGPSSISQSSVDNPLEDSTLSQLDEQVEKFVGIEKGSEKHLKILQSGARLARDKPDALKHDPIVSPEKDYFKRKKGREIKRNALVFGETAKVSQRQSFVDLLSWHHSVSVYRFPAHTGVLRSSSK
jgi:hypothetical protein